MKILIAGIPDYTKNYEAAFSACQVPYEVHLNPHRTASFDGLLLPGGGDIHPERFHQPNCGSVNINPALDNIQLSILEHFVQTGRPVLGICRGLQLINVYFGGDLIQNLPTASSHRYTNADQYHPVRNLPGSLLCHLYGNSCTVNSAHHQGCGRVGQELLVTQRASDGVVEALEHMEKPILGVQWHPERTGFVFRRHSIADGELLIRCFAEFVQSFPQHRGYRTLPHPQ